MCINIYIWLLATPSALNNTDNPYEWLIGHKYIFTIFFQYISILKKKNIKAEKCYSQNIGDIMVL